PKEVEDILLAHPGLRDACVVPVPHGTKGEVPVAFVVARETGRPREDEVKRFFLGRGAPYAHPRRVVFLDALPLGGTGKIDRNALRAGARELRIDACPAPTISAIRRTCASSGSRSRSLRRGKSRSGCRSETSSCAPTARTGSTAASSARSSTSQATSPSSR